MHWNSSTLLTHPPRRGRGHGLTRTAMPASDTVGHGVNTDPVTDRTTGSSAAVVTQTDTARAANKVPVLCIWGFLAERDRVWIHARESTSSR